MHSDLRYSFRRLTSSPGFTIPAVLALALGIGGNAALFAVVNALLLRPLSFGHPEALVEIEQPRRELPLVELNQAHTLAGEGAFLARGFPVGRTGESVNVFGFRVSPNLFRVLDVQMFRGRRFVDGEEGGRVAVLSYEYWRRSSSPATLVIGEESYTVVGVLPPEFVLQVNDGNIFVPYRLEQGRIVARLATGATLEQAQAEATAILQPKPQERIRVRPVIESFRTNDASIILLLEVAVGMVLLITCANIGNLISVRAAGRRREFAIRAAIGAGRGRLLRQLAAESALLGLAGGIAGLGLAGLSLDFVSANLPGNLVRAVRGGLTLDWRVVAFTAGVSILAVLLFGMLPALGALRFDLMASLRDASGSAPRRGRMAELLVVGEVAMALMLLVAAGLMVKSLAGLERADLGFRPARVLRGAVDLLPARYPRAEQRVAVFAEITRRLEALPGVEAVGLAGPQLFPFGGPRVRGSRFEIEGRPDLEPRAEVYFGDPGYPRSVGVPLRAGRWFTASDTLASEPVSVLAESLAQRWFADDNPIGRRVRLSADSPQSVWTTIVGIVGDVRNPIAPAVQPTAYRPFAQVPTTGGVFYVRAAGSASALAQPMRRVLKDIDPTAPQFRTAMLESAVHDYVSQQRFTTRVLGFFAALGLLLATAGIYGVMRCWVTARVGEIGVRMALGAARRDVIGLVLWSAGRAVAAGVTLGIAGAVAIQRVIASELHGVSPVDPVVFGVVGLMLGIAGIAAAYLPARRAAGIDPLAALRHY
jgi:predicted permease